MAASTDLSQILKGWLGWMRLQRALTWSLRGLVLGLALALTIGSVGLLQARLLRSEFLALVGALTLVAPLFTGILAYLWPIQALKAARTFDHAFHLDERISTALELDSNQRASSRLLQQQLDDAVSAARQVQPGSGLPLRFKRAETILAISFALLIGWVWFRGEAWFQAAGQARAVQQAVDIQEKKIKEILTQIKNDDVLTEEQKRLLSEPLEPALNALQDNPSLEGSVSIMASTAEKLLALSDSQAQQMSQALQKAGQQAAGQENSPLQSVGQELAKGNAVNAASQLRSLDVGKLNVTETQQLANQLETMAGSLESANPRLASQLSRAAQALRNGEPAAARQALDQAAKELAQTGQQLIFSQTASRAAGQMQQGAGQMLAAGGGQQTAPAGQPGTNQNGPSNGSGGSGSGRGESQGASQPGNESRSAPIPQNNGPGDGGESTYAQIYAPRLLGGDQGPSMGLPASAQDGGVIGQGPTEPSDSGQSLVPYSEVYSHYEALNQQAIESGTVPFEFIQIIRSYFDSLKP